MKYQYVIFDLDGTLTDSSEGITRCVQYALADAGIAVEDRDELKVFIGPPLMESFMRFYHMDRQQAERATAKYRERYRPIGMYENQVYEGVTEMLEALQNAGVHLAVATSKPLPFTEKILEHFGLTGYFETVSAATLANEDPSKRELIRTALEAMGALGPALMVGDRFYDIEGANELGIDSAGALYGFAPENELADAGAKYCIASPQELIDIVL